MPALPRRRPTWLAPLASLLALPACVGAIEHGRAPDGERSPVMAAPTTPGPERPRTDGARGPNADTGASALAPFGKPLFRRLTAAQYRTTVRALLGADAPVSTDLTEARVPGQEDPTTVAAGLVGYSSADVTALYVGAEAAADAVFSDPARRAALVGCRPAAPDDACVRGFLAGFGARAYRRPLTEPELERLARVVARTAEALGGDVWAGLRHATSAVLQSPKLLYLEERGEPAPSRPGLFRLTSWEMASRLSYGLTGGPPDEALRAEAAQGRLVDEATVRLQAERLLGSEAAQKSLLHGLLAETLQLETVQDAGKHPGLFPRWSKELARAMAEEAERLLEAVAIVEDAPLEALLTRRKAFVDPLLASFYGLPAPGAGAAPAEVPLPADGPRVGLLGTGAFLATQARFDRTSPTIRGKFIAARLLCRPAPPPPPDVNDGLEEAQGGARSVRERLERHRSDGACAGCHALMDPFGLLLEGFDAIGAHRLEDAGVAIDASAEVDGQRLEGLAGLSAFLAASPAVRRCLARQTWRFLAGAHEEPAQVPLLEHTAERSSGRLRALLVELAASDPFRHFVPAAAGGRP